jgi:glycosyltransferase involved in cell wall biosynthesis
MNTIEKTIREDDAGRNATATVSIIVPVYNEEDVIEAFYHRLAAVIEQLRLDVEMIFVNDGSTDRTMSVLGTLRMDDQRIGILDLSRNFGKEIAMAAGLDHALGDAVIIIDADLQDPPELIPELIEKWRSGYDVVYAKRIERRGESLMKRLTARAFYRVMRKVAKVKIPEDTGDFRLLSRRAVAALRKLRERRRFMKGMFAWIGFPQIAVPYNRDPRYAGTTKWSYWRLWNFAIEGITSFTTTPLYIATYVGIVTAFGALVFGAYIVVDTLIHGNPVPGYPSLMAIVLLLGGIQLITMGIIGEYLGRMFDESKNRPLYLLQDEFPTGLAMRREAPGGLKSG